MTDLDRRIGELMVRLRLPRRAATRQAVDEAWADAVLRPAPAAREPRRCDYHLAR